MIVAFKIRTLFFSSIVEFADAEEKGGDLSNSALFDRETKVFCYRSCIRPDSI